MKVSVFSKSIVLSKDSPALRESITLKDYSTLLERITFQNLTGKSSMLYNFLEFQAGSSAVLQEANMGKFHLSSTGAH